MGMLWNGALSEHTGAFGETAARFFAKDHTALETLLGAFQRALYAFSAAGITVCFETGSGVGSACCCL